MKKSEVRSQKSEVKERIPKAEINLLLITFVLLFIACCLLPTSSYAHKVSIYAYAEDGKVFAEGYFVDGSKAKNSLIEVFGAKSGKKLLEVKTDEKGEASFKIPEVTPLKLVITASMGHKNDYTVTEDEVREATGIPKSEDRSQKSEVRRQRADDRKQFSSVGIQQHLVCHSWIVLFRNRNNR